MRRLLVFAITVLAFPLTSSAQEDWRIDRFHSDLVITLSGVVQITETIAVDFGSVDKHGIFRNLPHTYSNPNESASTYTRLDVEAVTRDGSDEPYTISRNSSHIQIKIGDPSTEISGMHTYVITYTATGILRAFDDYDELYWNVTGNDWGVPITTASATIKVPAGDFTQISCYRGYAGATDECTTQLTDSTLVGFLTGELLVGEGMTVAAGFAKGIVPIVTIDPPPTLLDALGSPAFPVTAVTLSALGIGLLLRRWWLYGRDRQWIRKGLHDPDAKEGVMPLIGRETISVEYDSPDNLRPAEIGVLVDEKAHTLDVSATIVDLAVRGYLTITEIEKKWLFGKTDYQLDRTEKVDEELLEYERLLLKKLFSDGQTVKLSDLKNSFYKSLRDVKAQLYADVTSKQLFAANPETVRTVYFGVAVGLVIFGVALFFVTGALISRAQAINTYHSILPGLGVGMAVTGALALAMARAMPRKTAHGRELYRRTKGYELFVSGTEKYRQPFFERQNIFMEVLPYAMVFGVTDKLAQAFKEMGIEPVQPTWYAGAHPFNVALFATNLNSFSQSLSSAMASAPSSGGSGGGGFSGGGFGGGGGGSW
ncbi:MAG: DUF2207 domain-containing protein [Candidatus Andersenbacteria bacterium]